VSSSLDNTQPDLKAIADEAQLSAPIDTYTMPPPVGRTPRAGEDPVWSGWDVLVIAAATLGIMLLVQFVTVLVARHFAYPHNSFSDVAQKPLLALVSELLAYLIVAIYMALLIEVKYHTRFWQAMRWNWPGIGGVSFLGIGVLMLGLDMLGRFLPIPKTMPFDQFFERPLDAYLTAVFAITLGPLMEELFFRGFLYPIVARRMGAFWAVVLTSIAFGLIHSPQYGFSWAAVLIVCLVGVVLTTIRAVTKSVGSSFLAHVGYNGTLMAITAVATDGFRHMEKAGVLLF
jgi:membrane protease YdiL (CAAX protease family)